MLARRWTAALCLLMAAGETRAVDVAEMTSAMAPRTDGLLKSMMAGANDAPQHLQLETWDGGMLEASAREVEDNLAQRTQVEEAASASGGVQPAEGEGTYTRGAPKPPMAYGVPLNVGSAGIGSKDNGTTYDLYDGARVWKVVIEAPGARSLTLHFSVFYLPPGEADLFIYSNADTTLYYTHEDVRPDRKFVTPPIHGDRITLEYWERHGGTHDPPMRLHIARVMQGFREVSRRETGDAPPAEIQAPRLATLYNLSGHLPATGEVVAKGPHGDSGMCNNDITCQLGNGFDREKRAVVQILTGGSRGQAVCTGTLLNVQDTTKNYVITAHHCLGDSGAESVDYWGFLFNYERECSRFAAPRRFDEFVQGARLLFADRTSDIILLEITSPIPEHYRPYYQGWDAEPDNGPRRSYSIHHPSGDYKKISVDQQPATDTTCTFCGRVPNSHYLVSGWDDGTTERGSSGCGLIDGDTRRLVAVLSGGSASCPDNNGFDFFGKLNRAYDRGLRQWLVPVGEGAGGRKMDGREATASFAANGVQPPRGATRSPMLTADRLLALSPDGAGMGIVTTEGGAAALAQVRLTEWPQGARAVEVEVATSDAGEGRVACLGGMSGLLLSDTSVGLGQSGSLAAQLTPASSGAAFSDRCTLRFASAATYTMPQAVRVAPMSDGERDGDALYSLTFTVRTDPPNLAGGVRTVPAQNVDEDDREGEMP